MRQRHGGVEFALHEEDDRFAQLGLGSRRPIRGQLPRFAEGGDRLIVLAVRTQGRAQGHVSVRLIGETRCSLARRGYGPPELVRLDEQFCQLDEGDRVILRVQCDGPLECLDRLLSALEIGEPHA